MSDIQKARDVLARWRELALPGPWAKEKDTDCEGTSQAAITTANGPLTWDDHGGDVFSPETARLIVGTAGNPELLDAIDELLAVRPSHAHFVAAAILSADERMSA